MPIQKGPANLGTGVIETAELATNLVVTHALGSASTPSITFTGDTNTGIFSPTADTIAFAEGGAEVARFDSNGNLGIGTASPSRKLTVSNPSATSTTLLANILTRLESNGSGADCSLQFSDIVTNSAGISMNQGALVTTIAGGEVMRVNTSGTIKVISTIGVGNATPSTSGAGITFPATQSASSDANTLDDYEEGTFTPTIANFTVSGTTTLTGAYTKIGRMVFVNIKFENTGTIAHSTSAFISLPFAIPTGALPTGGIVMYVNNNSESFTSGKNGTQNTLDTEGGARFFPGSFTTTSAGQHLFFSGFYRTS